MNIEPTQIFSKDVYRTVLNRCTFCKYNVRFSQNRLGIILKPNAHLCVIFVNAVVVLINITRIQVKKSLLSHRSSPT